MTSRYTKAREWAGLSVKQAVNRLGWQVPALLTDIERESHMPSDATNRKLADLYGVSAAWLRGSEPVIPLSVQHVLSKEESPRLHDADREVLLDLFGAIYTPESRR